MEAQKTFWFIVYFLSLVLITNCSKPLKLEEPLTFKKEKLSKESLENKTDTELTLRELSKERVEKSFIEPEPLLKPQYRTQLTQKPLPPPPEEKKEEKPPLDLESLVGVKDPVVINVESMPLNDFIIYALGELLKVPFLMDEEVMKTTLPVTLRLPRALKPTEVLEAVVSHLEKLGLEVTQRGKVLSITKPKPKPTPPPPRIEQILIGDSPLETSAQVAYFIPLKYLRPHELDFLLKDLTRGINLEIKNYPKENSLLLIG
ncbi:MAG: hypothetical protein N3A56_08135, partial [Thermodesulfobacteriaceae bacterium]|nr:hypothetical protein [Thermodesulfobacteriaceae bacterium]